MSGKDEYYNKAKQEGYRARSAYKLQQLDETAGLLGEDNTVVDLGAAPGGWMQVAAERVGPGGTVVGVDRQRIDALEDPDAKVEYVRGDMTEERTKDEVRDIVGESGADLVISDMAPNITGENELDQGFFGADASEATLEEGSPTAHVDGEDPPALLAHGTDDDVVPYRSTTVLAERMRSNDLAVEVITGEGVGHGMIDDPEYREQFRDYMDAVFKTYTDPNADAAQEAVAEAWDGHMDCETEQLTFDEFE